MPFCTSCGKEVGQNKNFCEYCGAPVKQPGAPPAPSPTGSPPPPPVHEQFPLPPAPPSPPESHDPTSPTHPYSPPVSPSKVTQTSKNTKVIIAAAVILVIVLATGYFIILPRLSGTPRLLPGVLSPVTQTPTLEVTVSPTTVIPISTTVPTPTPNPYPNALPLKKWFPFSEGKTASEGTVYRYWINDTYQWHNDMDNKWYPQHPKSGNKYLLVFANVVNRGDTAFPYPKSNSIYVHYNGNVFTVDSSHYIPDKTGNREATPVEIGEVQYQSDLFNMEYVEDYGYSHGTTANFVYPGTSNAIDGYLIYEVPASLTPDKTFVEIVFTDKERAVWKLA
jgi:hypothetical protein